MSKKTWADTEPYVKIPGNPLEIQFSRLDLEAFLDFGKFYKLSFNSDQWFSHLPTSFLSKSNMATLTTLAVLMMALICLVIFQLGRLTELVKKQSR